VIFCVALVLAMRLRMAFSEGIRRLYFSFAFEEPNAALNSSSAFFNKASV
jgi:hypothetical protein